MRLRQPLAAIGGGLVMLSYAVLASAANGAPAKDPPESGGDDAEPDLDVLVKAVQNPVADMVSVPFKNETNYNIGAYDRAQDTFKIEPVIPFHLSERIVLITRTIVPIQYQPDVSNTGGGSSGLGDINPALYFSNARRGGLIYGIGPMAMLPTATQRATGSGKLSIGPAAVVLTQPGRWTFGALVSQVWSVAGPSDRSSVSSLKVEYFVHYNLPEHWFLTSAPSITANFKPTSGGDLWTIPFGGGFGKVVKLGKRAPEREGRGVLQPAPQQQRHDRQLAADGGGRLSVPDPEARGGDQHRRAMRRRSCYSAGTALWASSSAMSPNHRPAAGSMTPRTGSMPPDGFQRLHAPSDSPGSFTQR